MSRYILIAGANGVGKTTIYGLFPDLKGLPYINPDRLIREGGLRDILQAIDDCFCRNLSFVQETTLCGQTALKNIRRAREAGYELTIHYLGVESVEIAKQRIRARTARGGHSIPERDIERRYEQSLCRMRMLLPEADLVYFYDNTDRYRKIAKYSKGRLLWEASELPAWYRSVRS